MRTVAGCLWILLAAGCMPSVDAPSDWQPEGPVDCRAEVSATKVGLMQPFTMTVWAYLEMDKPLPVKKPPIPEGFVGEAVVTFEPHKKGFLYRRDFTLRPTRLGKLEIASGKVRNGEHVATTPKFEIEVTSILAPDDPAAVEAPHEPFPATFGHWPLVATGAALLFVFLLGWIFSKFQPSRRALPVEVPLPPHVRALRELERLRRAPRSTEAEVEAFYVEVSKILRCYLEERFGLHAPLRSTEEFLVEVERGDDLSLAHRQSLRQFLQQCDLVKFAKLIPGEDVHDQTLRIASAFVEETREDQAPDAVEETA